MIYRPTIMEKRMRTDKYIHTDIMRQFQQDVRFDASHIMVSVKKGVVNLTGRVNTYLAKLLAASDVWTVRGVRDVKDHLRTNSEITQAAWNALDFSLLDPGDHIHVSADDGVITLTGEVSSDGQRKRAISAIHTLPEVLGVINHVHVKSEVDSEDIKTKIFQELERNARMDASMITVEIEGSHVQLKGVVRSWLAYEEAEKAAYAIPGVSYVENNIVLTYAH